MPRWLDRMRKNGTASHFPKELAILPDTNPATVNRRESGSVRLSRKSCEKFAKIRSLSASEAHRVLPEKYILPKKT